MAIGSSYSVLKTNPLESLLVRFLGMTDLHSHFRTRPLIEWAKHAKLRSPKTIMEIGCGNGANIFELAKRMPEDTEFLGFDLSEAAIDAAVAASAGNSFRNARFYCQDCTRFQFERKPDVVLLMDFLEHIRNPVVFLNDIRALMQDDLTVLISVPTPRYPQIFGIPFHEKVGHLVDGYDHEALAEMLKSAGFEVSEYVYNTGLLPSALCYLYYNILHRFSGKCKSLIGLVLSLFRFADWFNGPGVSCSLFAVARPSCAGSGRHAN